MKVLAIASSGMLGGAELSLAEFLAHRPGDVDAVALLVADGPLRERLEQQGVPAWVARGYEQRPGIGELVRFSRSLGRLLERTSPDVAWATGLKAAALAAPACRLAHVPLVWHKVDFSLDRVLTPPLAAAVDGVVSVSAAAAEALGPLRAHRLLGVIGPPVRLAQELRIGPNESEPTIGTVASLVPYKGQAHILRAAAILCEEFPCLQVVLAGAASPDYPDYPRQLADLCSSLGISERVRFTGFVEDVAAVMSSLTVYVNATHQDELGYGLEGLSGAMLEASWVGLPVVATRAGGTPEGVDDGVTGTLTKPGDPAALASAIAPYLRDRALARRTGEAGARLARERFAPATAALRLFAALEQVGERRRDGPRI
jgi:glycosyltransferase involved in cell wall biosynthesis